MIKRLLRWISSLVFLFLAFWVLLGFAVYHQWASPWTVLITDPLVEWGAYNYGKPKIIKKIPLPASLIEDKIDTGLSQSLDTYYKLTPEDRTLLLKEGMVYAYHHWTKQTPPPENIKNLMLFIGQQTEVYSNFLKK